ncbi:MAG: aminodeoxychorismate synthase component I, partial [Actinobacteria bacterium]|nr:aminodeoxychorismate synthase component I [Actinomycetota bacterium]
MRLVRVPLAGDLAAECAPLLVADDADPVALVGSWLGSRAICASEPVARSGEDPFATLDTLPQVEGAVPGAVGGGWIGYLGYALGAQLEPVGAAPPRPAALPGHALAFYDHVLHCDTAGDWWFEALWTQARAVALESRLAVLRERLANPPAARLFTLGPLTPAGAGLDGHAAAVARCREMIAAGEIFETNLCLRLEGSFDGDPAALAVRVLDELRPSHGACLGGDWGALVSASPELFLRREGRAVASEPIKGTAPGDTAAGELAASAKDRAENVMIVDLMRNDLGRVCEYGTVAVRELCGPQATSGVWSLVSRVEGRLCEGVGDGA